MGNNVFAVLVRRWSIVTSVLLLVTIGVVLAQSRVSEAKRTNRNPKLQLISAGHALAFESDRVRVVSHDHVLTTQFVGSTRVTPNSSANPSTKPSELDLVSYTNLWDRISVSYAATTAGIFKSTYTVDTGGSPDRIRLHYNVPVQIDGRGRLVFKFASGEMIESAPVAWQIIKGKHVPVTVKFQTFSNGDVGFAVGSYDEQASLMIDPTLEWNTFLGSDSNDFGQGIAVDGSGNVYVTGQSTKSWGSPIIPFSTSAEAFVAKLDVNGNLLWNTFLGGNSSDDGTAIAVDSSGNVYVAGFSGSSWGAPLVGHSGSDDGFVAKLNSSGVLQWNTFFGSIQGDQASGIAVDSANVYVTGWSRASWGTPVRPFVPTLNDAFVVKLTQNGARVWNTFLGGTENDSGNSIAVDSDGNLFVAGESNGAWGLPVNAYTARADAFAAKVSSNGSLIWNTFAGTSGNDEVAYGIAADQDGNSYFTGSSAFLIKLNSIGVAQWNSSLSTPEGRAVVVDTLNNIFVTGHNTIDACTSKFNAQGVEQWTSFNGGSGHDNALGLAVFGSGNIYVVGTSDASWGAPVRPYQFATNTLFDAVVFKLKDLPPPTVQFNSSIFSASEGPPPGGATARVATIVVTRSGDTSTSASVDYATADGTAAQRTDYTTASGTLTFAPGQTTMSFDIPIIDDGYVEDTETVLLKLSQPLGATLGTVSQATLSIDDDEDDNATNNPLDDASFFVRQHYFDFLGRTPDSGGFNFWVSQITGPPPCGNAPCLTQRRISVSNAFFFELEFQQTGAYVVRLYRLAYGNNQPFPNPGPDPNFPNEEKKLPSYQVFSRDRAAVIGGSNLAQKQLELANAFVLRPEFTARYPASLATGPQFVDAILATIQTDLGVDLGSQRNALLALYNSNGRGGVVYRLADDNAQNNPINNRPLIDEEYNRAFVTTQYFGYLRRDPDIGGIVFWLGQVNSAPLRNVGKQNAMVCSFITSAEYQLRFSPVAPHSNNECPP